jgi:O-antigen/teichoic acid export membrane protein
LISRLRSGGEAHAAARAGILLSVAGVAAAGGNLIFNILIARLGGAANYGAIGVLLSSATIAGFLATGIQYSVGRITSSRDGRARECLAPSVRAVAPWIAAVGVCAVVAEPARSYLRLTSSAPIYLSLVLFACILANAVPIGLLIGARRFKLVGIAAVLVVLIRIPAGVLLARVMSATDAALIASIGGILIVSAVALFLALSTRGAHRTLPSPREQPVELPFEGGITLESAVGALCAAGLWMVWTLPVIFAQHSFAGSTAGTFAAAQLLASGVLFLTAPLATAFFPSIVRMGRRDVILAGLAMTLVVGVVGGAIIAALGPIVLRRFYGVDFVASSTLFAVLCSSATCVAVATYWLWTARARRHSAVRTGAVIAIAVICEVLVSALVSRSVMLLAAGPAFAMVLAATAFAALLRFGGGRRAASTAVRVSYGTHSPGGPANPP